MNDQIYIDTVRDQIEAGVYDHLLGVSPIDDMIVLDIGANIGEVSKYFAKYVKKVVAIEPARGTFLMLRENTKGFPNIECDQVALAPVDDEVTFYVNDINFTASSTVNTYGEKTTVEGRKLSSILMDNELTHVDVCKIDAEGAEGESLSLEELNKVKNIIKTYYIEVHNCPKTTWEHKLGTLVGNFARCGYTKMQIDGMAVTATK